MTGVPDSPDGPPPWDYRHLLGLKQRFQAAGLELVVIESAPPSIMEPIKLGLPNRDDRIERFCALIDNMGRVGIPIMCHNFMAGFGWMRTSMSTLGRGGALVSSYDHALMKDAPLADPRHRAHPDQSRRLPARDRHRPQPLQGDYLLPGQFLGDGGRCPGERPALRAVGQDQLRPLPRRARHARTLLRNLP